jgi:hypothetical protein
MADSYHHAVSSAKKWGGEPEEYLEIHQWFDGSKMIACDMRHRALRHHAEGVTLAVTLFGPVVTLKSGRKVPVRWIGEQHIREDFGFIPSFIDWMRAIKAEPWMNKVPKLDVSGADPTRA